MGIFDFWRRSDPAAAAPEVRPMAAVQQSGGGVLITDSGQLEAYMRGTGTAAGVNVSTKAALKNTTVLRCVSLISFSIAMLPLHLHLKADNTKADNHPLFRVLHRKPNAWQTAFEFRALMQQRALVDGNAYALIIRSGPRVLQLVPLASDRVTPRQRADWSVEYVYRRGENDTVVLAPGEVMHLRYGMSEDGISGLSLVKQAADAIALAIQTEMHGARLFKNGTQLGLVLKHPGKLGSESLEFLKASLDQYRGAENAHKSLILEEGMDVGQNPGMTSEAAQFLETRKHQIEDIARPFGVPRPLLNVDDTSWGSGIDVLGQFFVRYGLNPWFEAWQQAIERSLLSESEAELYSAKFNAGALLRGSMKDQADFFAKGLGAGGHQPFLHPDEPRDWLDLPRRDDLPQPMSRNGAPNEPAQST